MPAMPSKFTLDSRVYCVLSEAEYNKLVRAAKADQLQSEIENQHAAAMVAFDSVIPKHSGDRARQIYLDTLFNLNNKK